MKHFLRHPGDLPGFLPGLGLIAFILLASSSLIFRADPILSSWFTRNSSTLARVVQTTSTSTGTQKTNALKTWPTITPSNNTDGLAQSMPVYADVQRIHYTAMDLDINVSGLVAFLETLTHK